MYQMYWDVNYWHFSTLFSYLIKSESGKTSYLLYEDKIGGINLFETTQKISGTN